MKKIDKLKHEVIEKSKLFEEADAIEIGSKIRIISGDILIFNGEVTENNIHKIKELIIRGFNYTISN